MIAYDYRTRQEGIVIRQDGDLLQINGKKGTFWAYKHKCHISEVIQERRTRRQEIEDKWNQLTKGVN